MTDTQNFRPVSLAKVREWAKERFGSCIYPSCEEHLPFRDVLAICDIAEAAQALDKRNTSHDLDEALAKVRP